MECPQKNESWDKNKTLKTDKTQREKVLEVLLVLFFKKEKGNLWKSVLSMGKPINKSRNTKDVDR